MCGATSSRRDYSVAGGQSEIEPAQRFAGCLARLARSAARIASLLLGG